MWINNNQYDFKSTQITLPTRNPIPSLYGIMLDKLMLAQINICGDTSTLFEPMGNLIMLNIDRPGALR